MIRKVYINNHFHTHLSDDYNDRPEFHRHHEHALWIIYQVLKAGNNQAIVVGEQEEEGEIQITTTSEFRIWVSRVYPGFEYQLDKEIYTRYPHPDDRLK